MSLYDDEDLPGVAFVGASPTVVAEQPKPQTSIELPASFKLLQTQLQAKKAALLQQPKTVTPAKRIALTGVPELVSAWPSRTAPQPKLEVVPTVNSQARLIEDSGEVRFNQLTGKMESVRAEIRAMPTGEDDEEYDPFRPNDFETFMRRKREQRKAKEEQRERDRERDREKEQQAEAQRRRDELEQRELQPRRRNASTSSDEETEKEEERKRKLSKGVAIAPPTSLIEHDSLNTNVSTGNGEPDAATVGGTGAAVAARMMRRMGYKEGEGLGRAHQGIATALTVEKTGLRVGKILPGANEKAANIAAAINASLMQMAQSAASGTAAASPSLPAASDSLPNSNGTPQRSITNSTLLRNPSKVVVLRNMVGPGDVDDQLDAEVSEECTKYGKVTRCLIFEMRNATAEEAVRIFVEFEKTEHATKALIDLNGRYFGGRTVRANFYDIARFNTFQLADPIAD